jgi:transposase-like protein
MRYYSLTNLHCKYYFIDMGLKITQEVRDFYKQLTSMGGKARAKKYDHATLSEWAKRGGRPRKDSQPKDEKSTSASSRSKERPT